MRMHACMHHAASMVGRHGNATHRSTPVPAGTRASATCDHCSCGGRGAPARSQMPASWLAFAAQCPRLLIWSLKLEASCHPLLPPTPALVCSARTATSATCPTALCGTCPAATTTRTRVPTGTGRPRRSGPGKATPACVSWERFRRLLPWQLVRQRGCMTLCEGGANGCWCGSSEGELTVLAGCLAQQCAGRMRCMVSRRRCLPVQRLLQLWKAESAAAWLLLAVVEPHRHPSLHKWKHSGCDCVDAVNDPSFLPVDLQTSWTRMSTPAGWPTCLRSTGMSIWRWVPQ